MGIHYKQVSFEKKLCFNYIVLTQSLIAGLGSRAMTIMNYGFIALDLLSIISDDAGEYTCRVTSSSGTAQSSAILYVEGMIYIYIYE